MATRLARKENLPGVPGKDTKEAWIKIPKRFLNLARKTQKPAVAKRSWEIPDEPLRVVVYRMAEKGITRLPVVERNTRKFLGLVSLDDLLKARTRHLEEERRREQVLNLRFFLPGGGAQDHTETEEQTEMPERLETQNRTEKPAAR